MIHHDHCFLSCLFIFLAFTLILAPPTCIHQRAYSCQFHLSSLMNLTFDLYHDAHAWTNNMDMNSRNDMTAIFNVLTPREMRTMILQSES